jgi:hypothetical protein
MIGSKNKDKKPEDESGQVSEGPSGFGTSETSTGGADSVPSTPDDTPSIAGGEENPDLAGI